MTVYKIIIVITFFSIIVSSIANEDSTRQSESMELEKKIISNQVKNSTELKLDGQRILQYGLIVGAGFLFDKEIQNITQRWQDDKILKTFTDISNYGGDRYSTFVPGLGYLLSYPLNDEKLRKASLVSAESLIIANTLTGIIKYSVGRTRPFVKNDPFCFEGLNLKFDDKNASFPSGHSTTAWAMVTPFAIYYDMPALYIIPISVCFSRIYKDKHWLSDVVAGGIIGYTTGYILTQMGEEDIEYYGTGLKMRF